MGAFERMLNGLPDHISLDLRPVAVARVAYDGTCRLRVRVDEDELLAVVSGGSGTTTRLVLSDYETIDDLLDALDALTGFTVTVLDSTLADYSPIALVDRDLLLSEGNTLDCGSSVLWYLLRLLVASAGSITGRYQTALQQMNAFLAGGGWLDLWGWLYGVLRYAGESDQVYLRRLIWTVTLPRCDNRAIEEYLRRGLGIESRVVDTTREVFHLNDVTPDLYPWLDLAAWDAPTKGYYHDDGYLYIGTAAGAYTYLVRCNGYQHKLETAYAFDAGDGDITALGAFGDNLYVAQEDDIYAWDGSAMTLAHTAGETVVGMAAAVGLLFCLLADGKVVTFNGSTWNDSAPATSFAIGYDLIVWGSTVAAAGDRGASGGSVQQYSGGAWADVGGKFVDIVPLCLGVHADGLRAGMDDGTIYRFDGVDTWTEEYDTTQDAVTALAAFDGDLYAGTGTDAYLYRYDGSSWAKVDILGDGSSAVVGLVDFSKIGELVVLVDSAGRQWHYWRAVHSGNSLPSLLNMASNYPVLAPGLHLYAFTVYADIPEYNAGLIHPAAQVAQAVHLWKAAGTRFRLVDTTVTTLDYPTPAILLAFESDP